jgi:hypothetical protein
VSEAEDFEDWLTEMDNALDEFILTLPVSVREEMNYTRESLDLLESWILATFHRPEELLQDSYAHTLDGLARYVGETLRRTIGGKWRLGREPLRVPELYGPELSDTPVSPHSLIGAALDRRTGQYLSGMIAGYERMRARRQAP